MGRMMKTTTICLVTPRRNIFPYFSEGRSKREETASMPVLSPRLFKGRLGLFPLCAPLVVAALFLVLAGCNRQKPKAAPPTPVEVTVLEAKPTAAPMTVDGIGHVYAVRTVNVRSQVTGVIKKTLFAEGDIVKEGQSLLVIDPDSYKAKLDEAASTLSRDRATAAQAKRDWLRYKDLVAQAVISQDDYEQKRTAYQQAQDQVRVDEATVVNAKVNLDYCYIKAPCTGVVGLQSYKTGNLVEANKDIIITINQIEPVNVQFAVAEKYLPDIRLYAAKKDLVVEARHPQHPEQPAMAISATARRSASAKTAPVGLWGELMIMALVRGVMAAATAFGSRLQSARRNGARTGMASARSTCSTWEG